MRVDGRHLRFGRHPGVADTVRAAQTGEAIPARNLVRIALVLVAVDRASNGQQPQRGRVLGEPAPEALRLERPHQDRVVVDRLDRLDGPELAGDTVGDRLPVLGV
jgi:hypothetical protein